jgi:hypothetical protein
MLIVTCVYPDFLNGGTFRIRDAIRYSEDSLLIGVFTFV